MNDLNSMTERIKFKIRFYGSIFTKDFVSECTDSFSEILRFRTIFIYDKKCRKRIKILQGISERG